MARGNPDPQEFLAHRNPDQLYRESIDQPNVPPRRRTLMPTIFALCLVVAPVAIIWATGVRVPLVPPDQDRVTSELDEQRKENAALHKEVDELREKVELLETVIRHCPETKRYLEGGFYQTDP